MRNILLLIVCLFVPLAQAADDVALPPNISDDTTNPPEVTITQETGQMVEEYRANGRLYMIKITPKHGAPYYLIDERGDGKFVRHETLDSGLRVPRWILFRF